MTRPNRGEMIHCKAKIQSNPTTLGRVALCTFAARAVGTAHDGALVACVAWRCGAVASLHGSNVNAADDSHRTPLMCAVGSEACVEELLARRANVNDVNDAFGQTVLTIGKATCRW